MKVQLILIRDFEREGHCFPAKKFSVISGFIVINFYSERSKWHPCPTRPFSWRSGCVVEFSWFYTQRLRWVGASYSICLINMMNYDWNIVFWKLEHDFKLCKTHCLLNALYRQKKTVQIYQETSHIEIEGNFLPQVYVENAKNPFYADTSDI